MLGQLGQGTLLGASGSNGALVAIVLGEAAIIVLLIVLVMMLRRRPAVKRSGSRPYKSTGERLPPATYGTPAQGTGGPGAAAPTPAADPAHTPAAATPLGQAPPPVVSWDMGDSGADKGFDPDAVPIPAYTGPRLITQTAAPDIDFDLGIDIEPDPGQTPATGPADRKPTPPA